MQIEDTENIEIKLLGRNTFCLIILRHLRNKKKIVDKS